MVSSRCCQVESPSPLRFLAALIPPCAQTECDRLTGTMENRSTSPPISAILMTAESPASPPPTTIIFGFAILKIFNHHRGTESQRKPKKEVASSVSLCLCASVVKPLSSHRKSIAAAARQERLHRCSQKRIHRHRAHRHKSHRNHKANISP